MTKAWIQLAKYGDILSVLPVLNYQFQATGTPQNLIVAKQYSDILEGLEYVKPVVFDGHWQDLKGAIRFAKKSFDRVECFQLYGIGMNFEKRHPSFQLDQWDRVGCLDLWDNIPLVLPRRGKYDSTKHIISISDHSQSSPFFQKEELVEQIRNLFPNHHINRIAGKRSSSMIGILPEFDASDLVVCVDSSHLHLSAATKTPVIAMTADRPTFWHGSAWSKRFAFHCRYSDYQIRKNELSRSASMAVNKVPAITQMIVPTKHRHGYNMCIGRVNNSMMATYRFHPNPKGWKTRLAITNSIDSAEEIIFPESLSKMSLEDGRIFQHNDKTYLAYVCSQSEYQIFRSLQAYGPLDLVDGKWTVTKHIVPKMRGNDFSGMQKNWLPISHAGKLWFIHGISGGKQISIQVDGDKVVSDVKCDAPVWGYGEIRGGVIVRHKGKTFRFFHSRLGDGHKHYRFRYYIGVSEINPEPPFNTISVNEFPIYAGNEKYTPDCHHWKPNCALPYGAVSDDSGIKLSIGLNDCESAVLVLGDRELKL